MSLTKKTIAGGGPWHARRIPQDKITEMLVASASDARATNRRQSYVSVKTVEADREHVKQKMKFKSSTERIRFAIEYTLQEK